MKKFKKDFLQEDSIGGRGFRKSKKQIPPLKKKWDRLEINTSVFKVDLNFSSDLPLSWDNSDD